MKLVTYLILYPLILLISHLPFKILYFFSDITFYLLYYVFRYRRKVVRFNLEISKVTKSKSDLIRIEKEFYRHITDVFFEMFKFYSISTEEIKKRFYLENSEIIYDLAKEKKNVMFMATHYGGFEWFLSIGHHVPHLPFAIYTPLTNKHLDSLLRKIRLKHGSKLISRYEASNYIDKQIEQKNLFLYGMAADQSAQIRSITYWRHFLGVKVPVFTGSERIAKEHNMPVVFGKMVKIKRGHYKVVIEMLSEFPRNHKDFEITDMYIERVEKQIRKNPEYYFWTHNRFKHMNKAPKD
ncbi:MAG: lysophospholipid acyltransferase family protein [Bacteroidetes bacterium]|jgi:Kdo2-lipid IVA lauroyltransferase/acyltransferase|nr:lysophospholipid acyltransferase family protein [Bacteroidota bacterium]MDA1019182.1 lysophospholipid acyltransferase family protein [Bacteroidota bacterium]